MFLVLRYLWPFILENASDALGRKLKKLLPLGRFVCIPTEMQTCLPAVAQQLFLDIRKVYEETSQSKTRAGKVTQIRAFRRIAELAKLARSRQLLKLSLT